VNRAGERLPHLETDRSLVGSVGTEEVTAENPDRKSLQSDPALPDPHRHPRARSLAAHPGRAEDHRRAAHHRTATADGRAGPAQPHRPGDRRGQPGGLPSPQGRLRDPSNTSGDLRTALDRAGFPWATSHTFRKTVATRLDEAGLSARQIADHLGHSWPSLTQDVYLGRGTASPRIAAAIRRAL
jgi:integrase